MHLDTQQDINNHSWLEKFARHIITLYPSAAVRNRSDCTITKQKASFFFGRRGSTDGDWRYQQRSAVHARQPIRRYDQLNSQLDPSFSHQPFLTTVSARQPQATNSEAFKPPPKPRKYGWATIACRRQAPRSTLRPTDEQRPL